MEKTSFKFGSFILPKIKGGGKTAMLSNAYIIKMNSVDCAVLKFFVVYFELHEYKSV